MIGAPFRPARLPAGLPPLLLVVVDTEEEFDWSKPHDPMSRSVASIAEQRHAQALFEQFGVKPTYVVDHPVAATEASAAVFKDWAATGRCLIGAHLHPWVNPPEGEALNARNSYPGNLPAELEREKLRILTGTIAANIGVQPKIYKAGRYGLGANTPGILKELGYEIDLSVVPATDFSEDGGPNFKGYPHDPYWFGGGLLEIPLTRGYPGILGRFGEPAHHLATSGLGRALRLPGILARLRLVERIPLTPEGMSAADNCRLTRYLAKAGRQVFTYAYHSSSLLPGGAPYVRTLDERQAFLDGIEAFLEFFTGELGGRGTTPWEIKSLAAGTDIPGSAAD
ncbi:MAG: polysaccharide deacetylase family protein [Sphingomonadales bacterium]|nr:polysaccharide deacetylase family protein [Sphingomonadales bacterium]